MNTIYRSDRDSTGSVAMLIEIVCGLLGFLGFGWVYAGNVIVGVTACAAYLILLAIESMNLLAGCLIFDDCLGLVPCLIGPVNFVIIAVSGFKVHDYVRDNGARIHARYFLIGLLATAVFAFGALIALIPVAVGKLLDYYYLSP